MKSFLLLFGLLVVAGGVNGQETDGTKNQTQEDFRITSLPQVFDAKLNDIVTLPCEYTGRPDGTYRLWFHDQNVISVDEKIIYRREDFTLDGSNLKVNVSKPELADKYICKFNDAVWSNVTHTIRLLGPPIIDVDPKVIDTREGNSFSIHCTSSSAPKPTITYSKVGSTEDLTPFVKDGILQIPNASRKTAGLYKCVGKNEFSPDGEQTIEVKYQGRPDVNVAIQWHNLNSESEKAVEITCKVATELPVKIQWRKGNTDFLQNSKHFQISQNANMSILRINQITKELFDKYNCEATNSMGEGKDFVEISSLPIRPIVDVEAPSGDKVRLSLTTVSPYRVRAFRVTVEGPGLEVPREIEFKLPENEIGDKDGKYVLNKIEVTGLKPGSDYKVVVVAITEKEEVSPSTMLEFKTSTTSGATATIASSLIVIFLAVCMARN